MKKRLISYTMLLVATLLILAGCGGSGADLASSVSDAEKTAKVTLSFQFPEQNDVEKSVISDATTHILINVWQWTKAKDGTLNYVNFDRKLIDKSNPTATLDLLPTYTNICATQWNYNPYFINNREAFEASKLETVCTFGELKPGANNVNLRMIRGTWTLNTPFAFNNTTSLISFSLYRKGYPLYEYETQQGLNDTTYNDFNTRGMAKANFGSEYNVALKATKTYYGNNGYYIPPFMFDQKSQSIGFYTNFFGMGDTAPAFFIAKDETKDPLLPKGYVLFSLPKKTDSDGWLRQSKEFIESISYDYSYDTKLALVNRTAELRIDKWNGSSYSNNQTATILDPCVPSSVSSNTMTLCAGKEDSIIIPVTAFNQYSGVTNSYKVTMKGILSGVNICYDDEALPLYDNSGNLVGCYDYEYNSLYGICYNGGTYQNGRCERDLQTACYGGAQDPDEYYDSSSKSCIFMKVGYVGGINLTQVTATGVGKLDAGVGVSTSKASINTSRFKLNIPKR